MAEEEFFSFEEALRGVGGGAKPASHQAPTSQAGPTRVAAVPAEEAAAARAEVSERRFVPSTNRLPSQWLPVRDYITVLDRGPYELVVGLATATALNYVRAKQFGKRPAVSARMLYEYAQAYDEWPGRGYEGSSMIGAMAGLWRRGVCLDSEWPINSPDVTLSPESEQRALENRPQVILRVEGTVDHMRAAVFEHGAIAVSALEHSGWDKLVGGTISFGPGAEKWGVHAFAILGYTEQGFLVQDSTGRDWSGAVVDGQPIPGLAIWTYEDAAENVTDAWAMLLARTPFRHPLAGYDSDTSEGVDLLEIRAEVNAFAYVLASTAIKPPLAIGLFGHWGSGKSFFMRQMLERISALAGTTAELQASERKTALGFCRRVVQIRFNAWHYLDTDLWASLVTEIFDRLFTAIGGETGRPEDKLPALTAELQAADGVYKQAKQQLEDAQRALGVAMKALAKIVEDREAQEGWLARQLNDMATLVAGRADVRKSVEELARELGVPELTSSYAALEVHARGLQTLGRRFTALLQAMFATRWGWWRLGTFVAALLAPVAAVIAIEIVRQRLGEQIAGFHSFAIEVSAFLAALATWVGVQARRGSELLAKLEGTHRELERIRDARRRADVSLDEESVQVLKSKEDAARRSAQEAEQHVQALQREVDDLQPGRLLLRFIEQRSTSSDYRSRLGIVSLVRRDFERLSELADPESEKRDPVAMPIERIILYIDDLDRCSPERVIDVLEAVHLLLAFKLFMVVVAVDPRWLRRCLEKHYPDLLALRTQEVGAFAQLVPSPPATAQDYLEKIFQIPFSLQPLKDDGYRRMIRGLTKGNVTAERTRPIGSSTMSAPGPLAVAPTSLLGQSPLQVVSPTSSSTAPRSEEDADNAAAVELLSIRPWELEDMERLALLFRTPRSVKRFVNTYRFVRAGLRAHELPLFEGTKEKPGRSRAVLVLLAIIVGYPNVAARFFRRIIDVARAPKTLDWVEFLRQSRGDPSPSEEMVRSASGKSTHEPAPVVPRDWEEVEWRQLCGSLLAITKDDFPVSELGELTPWIRPVARFSFSLEALPTFET